MNVEFVCKDLFFPEGPVALGDGSVLVTEIGARCLTRIWADGRKASVVDLGGGPNGAAIGPDGAVYLCNNGGAKFKRNKGLTRVVGQADDYSGGRIERVDLKTGKKDTLYTKCGEHSLKGPNDLVFDRHGGFYFTDLGKSRERDRDRGGVYYATTDGSSISEVIFPMHTPNGIGLSPDEKTLFVAESETARLWGFRVTGPGRIKKLPYPSPNGGAILYGAGGYQRFDSLKVERNGWVCIGTLENGGITVVDPEQGFVEHISMPDRLTTNLCFTGADMRTVYVTCSSTGRLAKLAWPRPGLSLNYAERGIQHLE